MWRENMMALYVFIWASQLDVMVFLSHVGKKVEDAWDVMAI